MERITVILFLKLVRLLVGIISFIGLLSLDVGKAWKSKAHWVPQGALVLSAFSLQLLDLLDTAYVSISDNIETKRWDLERVLKNELLVDGGRVMVCVYMGYLLTEMARDPSTSVVWNDIGALALSVFSHVFSELYVFLELISKPEEGLILSQDNIPVNPLSIASRLCTGVCALLLFLLLGSAAFAGRTLHTLFGQKIPLVLKVEPQNYSSPENVKQYVFRSWVVAWVCKPDYVIARSVLASSVGVVVTVSVACYAAEWGTQNYQVLHLYDGIDWFRYIVTASMALLILIGWGIIFSRWMFAIFYFPGKYKIPDKGYFHVEDFWIRHIFEVTDDIEHPQPSWDQHVSGGGFLKNIKLKFLRAIKAHVFLRQPLFRLQQCIILLSRLCWFSSEKILCFCKTVAEVDPHFPDLKAVLEKVKMPGETQKSLLAASLKARKQTKDFMEKGRKVGIKSGKLIELLRTHSTHGNSEGEEFLKTLEKSLSGDERFDYLTKFSWKMTALSLIRVIIELEGGGAGDVVDAYTEAYDFLDLLDNPAGSDKNHSPQLFVRAADKYFIEIQQQLGNRQRENGTEQDENIKVNELKRYATGKMSFNVNDSADWWVIAANNSLEKVCKMLVETNKVPRTLADIVKGDITLAYRARRILGQILTIALKEEVGRELVNNCREWAAMLEDEKIKAAVYIAGKLSGVLEKHTEGGQRNGDREKEVNGNSTNSCRGKQVLEIQAPGTSGH